MDGAMGHALTDLRHEGIRPGASRSSAEFGGWIMTRMHAIAAFLITSILGWLVWSGLDGVLRAGIIGALAVSFVSSVYYVIRPRVGN